MTRVPSYIGVPGSIPGSPPNIDICRETEIGEYG